jgi:hypothetical protein
LLPPQISTSSLSRHNNRNVPKTAGYFHSEPRRHNFRPKVISPHCPKSKEHCRNPCFLVHFRVFCLIRALKLPVGAFSNTVSTYIDVYGGRNSKKVGKFSDFSDMRGKLLPPGGYVSAYPNTIDTRICGRGGVIAAADLADIEPAAGPLFY